MAWLLITVNASGEVFQISFPTEALAKEAQCLALYGETLEQFEENEQRFRKRVADHYASGETSMHIAGSPYDMRHGEWGEFIHGAWVGKNRYSIKTARIFHVVPDAEPSK